ncbi:hypothetical protein BKA62DRAFT_785843 [Auriculariales sp. MPI-PUGE-AT-0066]|nr:hypothetical protein BKA62DRAFT_785843 [Auriculariales sp. MPI-PUGE-AT-0066]
MYDTIEAKTGQDTARRDETRRDETTKEREKSGKHVGLRGKKRGGARTRHSATSWQAVTTLALSRVLTRKGDGGGRKQRRRVRAQKGERERERERERETAMEGRRWQTRVQKEMATEGRRRRARARKGGRRRRARARKGGEVMVNAGTKERWRRRGGDDDNAKGAGGCESRVLSAVGFSALSAVPTSTTFRESGLSGGGVVGCGYVWYVAGKRAQADVPPSPATEAQTVDASVAVRRVASSSARERELKRNYMAQMC